MDFKKIENIFLVAFLLLNVYLFIGFLNRYDLQYAATSPSQVNLIREMEQVGVELPVFEEAELEIFAMQADANNLLEEEVERLEGQAGSITEDGTFYQSILSDPIELEGTPDEGFGTEDIETLDEFVNSPSILFGEEYEYNRFDAEESRFVYFQNVNGIPIADGSSEISLYVDNEGNIYSYQQTYAGPMTEQGSPLEIISDRQAVEILFQNNEISSNVTVRQPTLVYYRTLHLEDLSLYGPVWLVRISGSSGESILRVDAVDGSILSEPVAPIEELEQELEEPELPDEDEEVEEEADEEVPDDQMNIGD